MDARAYCDRFKERLRELIEAQNGVFSRKLLYFSIDPAKIPGFKFELEIFLLT
jgi:hypothetical protein